METKVDPRSADQVRSGLVTVLRQSGFGVSGPEILTQTSCTVIILQTLITRLIIHSFRPTSIQLGLVYNDFSVLVTCYFYQKRQKTAHLIFYTDLYKYGSGRIGISLSLVSRVRSGK